MDRKKIMGRKLAIGLSLVAVAITGTAYAEQGARAKRDADANGVLTRAEAQTHAAAAFARIDANKDGKLDPADRAARRLAVFDRLDADKSGQLSREEFSARPQRLGGEHDAKPEGWGGRDHHRGGWGHHGGRGHRGGMLGAAADADKDGAISQAEFSAAALQRFDRTDANKDGQVTREERQAARQQKRERWQGHTAPAAPATGE